MHRKPAQGRHRAPRRPRRTLPVKRTLHATVSALRWSLALSGVILLCTLALTALAVSLVDTRHRVALRTLAQEDILGGLREGAAESHDCVRLGG